MRNKWSLFKQIWVLQFENYKKDIFNLFSGWIITLITLLVWLTFKETGSDQGLNYDKFVLASALGVCGIRNCLFNFIRTIYEYKNTQFFDKVFSSNISKSFVFFTMILFNQVANIIVTMVLFLIAMLYSDQRAAVVDVNWWLFLSGYLLLLIMSNAFAFIISFLTKKLEWAHVIGNVYYFGSVYLLGLGIPYNELQKIDAIIYISYIFPQRYVLNIMASGWINDPKMQEVDFGYHDQLWIPYLVALVIIAISFMILYFIFKHAFEFENRRYKQYINKNKHLGIIYSIKRTTSIDELNELVKVKDSVNKSYKELQNQYKELRKKQHKE
ncbi:ABC transporter permease [Spiroplasma culicicola]|uniref:ABC-2 type transporter transmembrane domain-containing protein n=1 Tax=Spiroplasma culicicola AES-1 TaxID=1276246 RepID=W6A7J6_9MOLU|nr:ABC transporter permease [Spiroplasma culicicola]AHI53113.1 hypothetical protein SCULI_v1c07720 [Spiroplasma culicicola AES-1]